ncbi:MAG: Ca2+/Na+ antiporter [Candidatus Scalindua rubra]|uniref:Ca2+/Na+ antiporter n=1 Tax=Candidatus Scalindua rubra TaxID=1872076 RepID=A0A1E3X5M6_9BACT|nr:MAG: Ca2+/Na+ antiporter [Candidatus Scalindua rubra]
MFIVGITGVYFGAEGLVRGSSNLSRDLGIKPIIIGLTVVAFGTSSPELAVSLTASIKESDEIAIGNIIGSNIANIGLVLGVAAIVLPLKVESVIMKKELPLMIAFAVGLYLMAIDTEIGFVDGLFLFTGIILYISYQIYNAVNSKVKSHNSMGNTPDNKVGITKLADKQITTRRKNLFLNILYIVLGLTGLLIGAHLLVKAAIFIAGRLGISEMVIGLTVVAFGTSVPEMATSVVSALRKEVDICVGNVIGSNIFNILMVIGSVALIRPLNVAREALFFELPAMLLFSAALIPMIRGNLKIKRIEGFLLVLGYFIFIFLLFR